MNWPSYYEDIEELRHQNRFFQSGIDDLIKRLRIEPTLGVVHRVEADYRKLCEQLIEKYETHKAGIEKQFEEAVKLLQDQGITRRFGRRRND